MRPETLRAAHPHLTWPGYSAYMPVAFWAGLTIVGFGALDLILVVPLGAAHLAAVGQADILATEIMVGELGFSGSFSSRLARPQSAGCARTTFFAALRGFRCRGNRIDGSFATLCRAGTREDPCIPYIPS
ncbi:MAG: hypothetical protein MJH10_03880 [Epibacterium sp.]|nr:hypothetical protein [Epibacterium sp.]NQX72692.1 hypothetical protein [Epibacterium sp.]